VYWGIPLCSIIYVTIPEQGLFIFHAIITGLLIFAFAPIIKNGIVLGIDKFSREKACPIKIPEMQELANKLGLELSPQPFWEINKKNMKAKAERKSNKDKKILFGKEYLHSLTKEEKVFVAGHEFFHLYGREDLYYFTILVPVIVIIIFIQFTLNVPQYLMIIGNLGIMIGYSGFARRSIESIADIEGARNVDKKDAINALKKAYVGKENKSFYTHPSINARIKNLENYYKHDIY